MLRFKRIFSLGGLTVLGQLAPFIAVIWLSRTFSPESYQYFAEILFYSMFSVVFATARLEHIFVTLKKRRFSRVLATQILVMSIFIAGVLSVGYAYFFSRLGVESLVISVWLLIVSMSFYSVVSSQAISYELIIQLSYARLMKGVCDALTPFIMVNFFDGWLALTFAAAISFLIPAIYLCSINGGLRFKRKLYIIYYLKRFSLYEVWSGGLNTLCNMLPVYFISSAYGDKVSGVFSFLYRYFSAISSLLFNTIGVIFRVNAVQENKKFGCYKHSFLSTVKISLLMSFLLGGGIVLMSYIGWDVVLGKEWGGGVNNLISTLYILFFVKIISLPVSYSFYLASAVKANLFFQIALFVLTLGLGFLTEIIIPFNDFILIYSIVLAIYYVIYVVYAYRLSWGKL